MKAYLYEETINGSKFKTPAYVGEIEFKHWLPMVGDKIFLKNEEYKVVDRQFHTNIANNTFSKKPRIECNDVSLIVEKISNNYIGEKQNQKKQ